MSAAGDPLPSDWARLHPLSPIVAAGRGLLAIVVVLAINGASHRPYPDLAVLVLVVAAGVVSWLVTRWRIHNSELQINKGLVRRQQIRVPLTRIQGVDIVRPLLARMLGMAEVRLILAGRGTGTTRLSYLGEQRAHQVRARLLALAHGLADDTPEPPERPVLTVPGGRIVAGNLLAGRFLLGVVFLAGAIAWGVVDTSAAAGAIGTLYTLLGLTLLVTFRRVSAEWEFHVAEAPDGLRLRSGLLQTRAETIPHGRVQAVRWIEPLWWRPLGWVRLEVDVARRRNADRSERESGITSKALLPVGYREDARWLLGRVFPGAVAELDRADAAPRRAVWRVPLARGFLRARVDNRYVACSTGRVRPDVVVVPLEKVQSIRWSQGPWSRRLRLASVHLDTAGQRFTGRAGWRDAAEAERWIAELPDLARAARAGTVVNR